MLRTVSTHHASSRVSARDLLAYAVPATGVAFHLFFIQFYFLKFATDVLLAAPAVIGVLMGLSRVWDAVSDPLVGYWSDGTRSRLGRRRPWMLAGIPLLAVFTLMVWSPPERLGGAGLVIWTAVALFGFYTAFTFYTVPHTALGAELSDDHHERTRVFGAQRIAFVLGMLIAFVAIGWAGESADPRRAVVVVAVATALLGSLALLPAPALLAERPEHRGRGAATAWAALRDVLRNPHARLLLAAWFVEGLGFGVLGVLAPFFAEYVMHRNDLIAVLPAFFVVAGVISIPAWIALSRRMGKRKVWLVAMVGQAVCFGATLLLDPDDIAAICILLAGAGMSNACGGAIGLSMLADVVDADEIATGERKEGAYFAAWGFALKLAVGTIVAGVGFALELSGFVPNAAQPPATVLMLRLLFAGTPVVAAVLAFGLMWRFRLDAREHARLREEIRRRAHAATSPDR
jgi:GPH family glycoside/pentoside/hexuronide:cation symporter